MAALKDWVRVVPAPDQVKATARALIALALEPHDVRTAGTGTEFLVPPYLADLYNAPAAPKRRRTRKEEVSNDGDDL